MDVSRISVALQHRDLAQGRHANSSDSSPTPDSGLRATAMISANSPALVFTAPARKPASMSVSLAQLPSLQPGLALLAGFF
ncbi:hypothetical protein H4R35_005713 [Dimargaris xerosporica]|nr:hypothetical protein H4R35_005713 [Dimargaris xerosporica]